MCVHTKEKRKSVIEIELNFDNPPFMLSSVVLDVNTDQDLVGQKKAPAATARVGCWYFGVRFGKFSFWIAPPRKRNKRFDVLGFWTFWLL
jgi:hypothetical protein